MVFTQIMDGKSGLAWDAVFFFSFAAPIGSPLKRPESCVRKSTETRGEWHGIRDGLVTHRQPKSNGKVVWSLIKNTSPAKHNNCLTKKKEHFLCHPLFFYDLSAKKEKKGETQPQSDGAGEHSVLIALIANNMFLRVARQRRLLGGEKGAAAAAAAELLCQDEPLSSRPPLPVSSPQTRRGGGITGAFKWTCEEMGQRSTLTQFAIPPPPRPPTHPPSYAKWGKNYALHKWGVNLSSGLNSPVINITSDKISTWSTFWSQGAGMQAEKEKKKKGDPVFLLVTWAFFLHISISTSTGLSRLYGRNDQCSEYSGNCQACNENGSLIDISHQREPAAPHAITKSVYRPFLHRTYKKFQAPGTGSLLS